MLLVRHTNDTKVEAGLDEAGRGSFWGPIMAGAVIWPTEDIWTEEHRQVASQIRDSKKISPKKREKICDEIKKLSTSWGIGSVSSTEIDENGNHPRAYLKLGGYKLDLGKIKYSIEY